MPNGRFAPPVDGHVRLLTKVARMYHERGIRQAEIAVALNISQAKVSRLLKRAAALGIVRTTVTVAPGVYADLEEALEQRFGLMEAVVVDIDTDADDRETMSALGAGAASYVEASLSGSDRIGISSWSQTLLAMVERLRPLSVRGATEVVQLLGGIGAQEVQNQAQRLLGDLARLLGAEPVYVQAPGIVADRQVRDGLLRDSSMTEVTRRWQELTMALVGIGTIEPSDALAGSGNAFSAADRERLIADGAVGNVCHHYFDATGTSVAADLDSRTISIPVDEFLAIPRRIGVAGGASKHRTVRAAVTGGWVNVLVTDLRTAEALLEG
ncbi:sugar-binding transcriptional regulator [Agromyces atrinae]|uniref:DNA-binding transcriptional regulator LsrR (DeoR family) n=2 Tax=Agromyces atrinae TaxID=592376 RepID=A0A852S5Z9_9MICO|nr:sugar-binding transcriptional regulator [Agromyces atrinae]NYD67516.1 DNA-binding transcriptional regulator LsrR (DeoR family) [Agromyces atrinae]